MQGFNLDSVQCPSFLIDINKLEDDKTFCKCTLLNLLPWPLARFIMMMMTNVYDRGGNHGDNEDDIFVLWS